MTNKSHDWIELGVAPNDRASFLCQMCNLRVSAMRPGAYARITAAGASSCAYPPEALPTPEEMTRGGCVIECPRR